MTAQQSHKRPFLSIAHIIAITVLAIWWAAYFWQHIPSRDVLRLCAPAWLT